MYTIFFTGRNEVVAKVIFLHLFVILFTGGGVSLGACWETTPPGADTPPRADTPLGVDTPPEQTHPPEQTSPPEQTCPPEQTPAYGQWAVGKHPTGMHSCWQMFWLLNVCFKMWFLTDHHYKIQIRIFWSPRISPNRLNFLWGEQRKYHGFGMKLYLFTFKIQTHTQDVLPDYAKSKSNLINCRSFIQTNSHHGDTVLPYINLCICIY